MAAEVQRAMEPRAGLPNFAVVPAEPAFKVPKLRQWEAAGTHQESSALPSLAMLVVVMLVCSGVYVLWQKTRHTAPAQLTQPVSTTSLQAAAPKPAAPPPVTAAVARTEKPLPPPGGSPATLHASLTADEPTWVRAWADGKEVMTAMLEPNLIKTVDAVGEIRLRTGNAGALQIMLNGKPVRSAGPKGQIRIVNLTPQGVQILVPPKPVPVPAPL